MPPCGVGLEGSCRRTARVAEAAQGGDGELEGLAAGDRRLAELAGGHLDVLLLDRRRRRPAVVRLRKAIFSGSSQTRML